MFSLILLLAIIFVLAPVAQAYARRLNPPDVPGVKPGEIARLREELEQLAATVNRLQDEQSFMVRLLSEQRPTGSLPPSTDQGNAGTRRSDLPRHGRQKDIPPRDRERPEP
jgi:hypothetical protein